MFIGLICLGLCSYLGFYFSSNVKKEKDFLKGIIMFNKNMIINLEYEKKSITEFIKSYKDKQLKSLLDSYIKQLNKGKQINLDIKNKEIKSEVEAYFSQLGKSNALSQVDYVKGYEKIFQMKYEELNLSFNKKISLYPKLGILMGGVVFIMLL